MASDQLDNGDASVLVLLDGQGRLDEDELVLPGGGAAEVFLDEDGDTLVQVDAGKVRSQELVRAVLRSPALTVYGDVLDLVVATNAGNYDRYVMSADLDHRFLFTRQWNDREQQDGPVITVVGHQPSLSETHGDDGSATDRLRASAKLAADEVGAPAKLHVVNLFTRRAEKPEQVTGDPGDRREDAGQRAEALEESDAVVAAWGVVAESGQWAVDATVEELRDAHDRGAKVLLRSRGDEVDAVGSPPQPAVRAEAGDDDGVVDAPSEWLYGGELG